MRKARQDAPFNEARGSSRSRVGPRRARLRIVPPGASEPPSAAREPSSSLEPLTLILTPDSVRELVGYVAAVLHVRPDQTGAASDTSPRGRQVIGPLTVDFDAQRVLVNGKEVHLTAIEMRLLTDLVENRGQARSRSELLRRVWGYSPGVSSRSPDSHVRRLRGKLGAARDLIETVRGFGFRLSTVVPLEPAPRAGRRTPGPAGR